MFDITIEGIPKIGSGFLRPAWREIGELVLGEVRSNFVEGGAKAGGWAPLSKVTALLREVPPFLISNPFDLLVKWRLAKPLIETGELMKSFYPGAPGNVFEVEDDQVVVGSELERAEFHQTGGAKTFEFNELKLASRFTDDNYYYRYWRVRLRRMAGKVYFVPARPILFPMNYLEPKFREILERLLNEAITS